MLLKLVQKKSVYSNYDEDHDDVDDDYFPFYRFVIMKISSSLMMTILMFTSFMMTIMLAAVKETFWFIDFFYYFFLCSCNAVGLDELHIKSIFFSQIIK